MLWVAVRVVHQQDFVLTLPCWWCLHLMLMHNTNKGTAHAKTN
jgi:hypothetical protein